MVEDIGRTGRRSAMFAAIVLSMAAVVGAAFVGSTGHASSFVFWQLRVPRVLTGFLAGAGLALGGVCYQGLFRNSLATPYTLGVSGGAALAVALVVRLTAWLGHAAFSWSLAVAAFCGAWLAAGLVGALVTLRRRASGDVTLLAGVAVSFLFSSLVMFIQYLGTQGEVVQVMRWLMGSLDVYGYGDVAMLGAFCLAGGAVVFCHLKALNLLAVGDEYAASRGVSPRRVKWQLHASVSLIVGGVVAFCGPIGFVGMITPHVVRLVVGSEHCRLAPLSAIAGGAFLVLCDGVARVAVAPAELPVGIVTALVGGPFFLWLLLKR